MPGLTNLTKFTDELQTLGNELNIRKERGEPISVLPLPENISDEEDLDNIFDDSTPSIEDTSLDDLIKQNADLASLLGDTPVIPSDDISMPDFNTGMNDDDDNPFGDIDAILNSDMENAAVSDATAADEIDDELLDGLSSFMQDQVDVEPENKTPNIRESADNTDFPLDDFSLPDFDIPEVQESSFSGSEENSGEIEEREEFVLPEFPPEAFDSPIDTVLDENAVSDDSGKNEENGYAEGDMPDFDSSSNIEELSEIPESYGEEFADFKKPDDLDDFFVMKPDEGSQENFFSRNDDSDAEDQSKTEDSVDEFENADDRNSDSSNKSSEAASFDTFAFGNKTDDIDGFHIPGFSDIDTVSNISKKITDLDSLPEDEFAPVEKNTFTDKEYASFLENLASYPLNLRIAIEELIANDEFTDDVTAALILKVSMHTSAKKLAESLGRILGRRIDIPRDYEMRTAAEYASYKSSFIYKLINRILPAVGIAVIAFFIGLIFFYFGREYIYKPLKAESLYTQGYALLQADQYAQSFDVFNTALSYYSKKKWFFRYAQGYRDKHQYAMAELMYEALLNRYKNDKKAGLEYATMEFKDILNYEKAEEIVKRRVLDNYVNDEDGLLLLGDIYLDWATEKDETKFEDARHTYASLLQLYGDSDVYYSRLMRYFIRTDNLSEVLVLKDRFFPRKKSLGAQDLTELSGFLLDKLYAPADDKDDYLRPYIEDVRTLLERSLQADPSVPEARYNLARYFVYTGNQVSAQNLLESTLQAFEAVDIMSTSRVLKNVDAYRLLGEIFIAQKEYIRAEEILVQGVELYEREKARNTVKPDSRVGKLYADLGDLDYFISGDFDRALVQYTNAIEKDFDVPSVRYRIGYIQYNKRNYVDA